MHKGAIRLLAVLGALLAGLTQAAQAQAPAAPKYEAGVHYTVIENAPARPGDNVEVVEAFSYMCPHCGTFEPYVASWEKRLPDGVEFRRIPVVFGRSSWELYARAYVTAEMMGIADKAHGALMDKIWKDRDILRDMDSLAQFYAQFGADPEEFVATSKSFAVDARLRREQRELQDAGVRGTPSMIINGKYLVAGGAAVPNYDVLLDVVDYLVARELEEQAKAGASSSGMGEHAALARN